MTERLTDQDVDDILRATPQETEERVEHHCAIVGVYDPDGNPVDTAHAMLYHMNHRGQEGSMIAVEQSDGIYDKRGGPGWVSQAYTKDDLHALRSRQPVIANGQNRYSTSGELDVYQPFVTGFGGFDEKIVKERYPQLWEAFIKNPFSLTHNGNLTNAMKLLSELPEELQTLAKNDTAVIFLHLVLAPGDTWQEKIRHVAGKCEGAANLIINANKMLYAFRDPWGFRPLSIGKLPFRGEGTRQGYVVASENGPFDASEVEFVRDVLPGEGVVIDEHGVRTFFVDERVEVGPLAQCIFELVYFAAPDSVVFGKEVSQIRREIGRVLARKDAKRGFLPDVVVPIQHSGLTFAEGYASEMIYLLLIHPEYFGLEHLSQEALAQKASSLQTQTGLVANIYANGRSFINPDERAQVNSAKHRADRSVVNDAVVALIDDSIVRGGASKRAILRLRKAGAKEIHLRCGYPYVRHACFMGVDFQSEKELIVNQVGEEGVASAIDADSLDLVTTRELLEVVVGKERFKEIDVSGEVVLFQRGGFCGSCIFTKPHYPVDVRGVYAKVL